MAKIKIDLEFPRFPVERKIFGHFTEHAFGNIYGGMYDPESPKADEDGLRSDVLELMRRVNVPLLRYPGGNFVSNYHWEDGIGPKKDRKRVFEYAWLTEESNQFGTADFIALCRKVGAEPLICVNMGSGTPEEAMPTSTSPSATRSPEMDFSRSTRPTVKPAMSYSPSA